MSRLNEKAARILEDALTAHKTQQPVAPVQETVVRRRWDKLREQSGSPADYGELRDTVADILPKFDDRALQRAARANRSAGFGFGQLAGLGLAGLAIAAGGIWLVNLPFPPVRRPVARVAPILLLPSFFSMDRHYRGAIASVEQADQFANQATSTADLERGQEKVDEAQAHLDRLPVWFLGYYPQAYCTWVGCTWRFTHDEFEQARKLVARTDARLFQETNAQTLLAETVADLEAAKAAYQQAADPTAQARAIAAWQAGLDRLREVPPATLAGEQAATKRAAFERDFQAAAGFAADNQQAGTAVQVAQQYAWQAAKQGQNPPHPARVWEGAIAFWDRAIAELDKVTEDNPDYVNAQRLRVEYQASRSAIAARLAAETASVAALREAKDRIADWQTAAAYDPASPRLVGGLQAIANALDRVEPGTTAAAEAAELRQFANRKLADLQRQVTP